MSHEKRSAWRPAQRVLDLPGVSEEAARNIPGITEEDARAAMEYRGAAAEIERLISADQGSVREGASAPDFELARLQDPDGGERVKLSDSFGKRPVALVFGSYT